MRIAVSRARTIPPLQKLCRTAPVKDILSLAAARRALVYATMAQDTDNKLKQAEIPEKKQSQSDFCYSIIALKQDDQHDDRGVLAGQSHLILIELQCFTLAFILLYFRTLMFYFGIF